MVVKMDTIEQIAVALGLLGVTCLMIIVAVYLFSVWFRNALKDTNEQVNDAHRRSAKLEFQMIESAKSIVGFDDSQSDVKIPLNKRWRVGNVWFGSFNEWDNKVVYVWFPDEKRWRTVVVGNQRMILGN